MGISTERSRAWTARWRLNTEGRPASAPLLAEGGDVVAGVHSSVTTPGVADGVQSAGAARSIGEAWAAIRARLWPLSVLALAPALVLLIDFIPSATHISPTLRATGETVMTLFAFAGAWRMRAQFGSSRHLRDLLLLGALLTLGITTLFSRALPAALDLGDGAQSAVGALWGELFVAAAFAAAAFAPPDRLIAGRRSVAIVAALSAVAVAVSELGGLLLSRGFVGGAHRPLLLVFVFLTTGSFIYGALTFASMNRRDDDGLRGLLAAGAVLLAAASFSHVGLPLLAAQRVPSREVVRLLAFAVLLAAALRQELQVRGIQTQAAATAERRRVAQDLHDGLAQDLALIAAHGARMGEHLGDEHPVAIAARRALATSRSAIAELSDPAAVSPQEAFEAIAYELRDRFQIKIAVHAHLEDDVAPDAREQLTRIAREAIANAARHGGAKNVVVSLRRSYPGVVLRVSDDGSGIGQPSASALEGFGLRSMRERAASLGGQLTVRQPRKRGTELEVLLP